MDLPSCPKCRKRKFSDPTNLFCPACGTEATNEIKVFLNEFGTYREREIKRLELARKYYRLPRVICFLCSLGGFVSSILAIHMAPGGGSVVAKGWFVWAVVLLFAGCASLSIGGSIVRGMVNKELPSLRLPQFRE